MSTKFYRHTFTYVLLSDQPIDGYVSLGSLESLAMSDCVGYFAKSESEEITPKQAADALYDAGSEPAFFQLDDDGKHLDED